MSLFFSRISKLSARREKSRFFSSLPQFPCLLLADEPMRQSPEGDIVSHRLLDATTEKILCSSEKNFPKELRGNPLIGASQGWVASVNTESCVVQLSDLYKPWVLSPRFISLPALEHMPSTDRTTKVSLSSDPLQDDPEFCVAARFNDYELSVCKPTCDSEWTHIKTPKCQLLASEPIYSKRDKVFYFIGDNGPCLGSLDLSNNNELKYQKLHLRNEPKIPKDGMLDKCIMSKHLVESPSGELLFIKWYKRCLKEVCTNGDPIMHLSEPKLFMVFREDEKKSKDFCYMEDIGDLCIFLGESEAFCLSATMYPGLNPNSIYYIGQGVGSYDLDTHIIDPFRPLNDSGLINALYWLHPTDPIHEEGSEKGTEEPITCLAEEVVEKPQELFLEKQVVEKPQELFLETEVHENITTKKFSNQGFEKEEVHSKITTKKYSSQGLEEEEVHSKILTKTFSSQGLEEEEVVERTTRNFR